MQLLIQLKDYLYDRPESAFLALTLVALGYMFRKYDKAQNARVEMAQVLAPLADKLCWIIERLGVLQKKPGGCQDKEV